MWNDPVSLFPYLSLLAAIASLWLKRDVKIWGSLSVLAVVSAIVAGRLEPVGALSVAGLAVCYYRAQKHAGVKSWPFVAAAVLSVLMAVHLAPGFNNWKVVDQLKLSEASLPYSMWLNLDKPFIGLFILGFGFPLIESRKEWGRIARSVWPIFAVGLVVLIVCGHLLGYVFFDPKWRSLFGVWAVRNVFFTCAAEEAFFRGFLQRRLSDALERFKWGSCAGLAAASILFGAAHFSGGPRYVVLASIAGFMYGWAYEKTGKIEASIACHFGVNAVHFIFFTYPAAI